MYLLTSVIKVSLLHLGPYDLNEQKGQNTWAPFLHTKREENKFNQTKRNDEFVFMIHKGRHLSFDYNNDHPTYLTN